MSLSRVFKSYRKNNSKNVNSKNSGPSGAWRIIVLFFFKFHTCNNLGGGIKIINLYTMNYYSNECNIASKCLAADRIFYLNPFCITYIIHA